MKTIAICFVLLSVTFASGFEDERQLESLEPENYLFPEILCMHKDMIKLTEHRQDLGVWLDRRERSFMRLALEHSICNSLWGKTKTVCLTLFQKSISAFRKKLEAEIPAEHKDFIPAIMNVVANCLKIETTNEE